MKHGGKHLFIFTAMLMLVCSLTVTAYGIDGVSNVVYVNKITDMFIEVGYTKGYDGKDLKASDYKVTVNGREVDFELDAFFDDAATLRLKDALTNPENDVVKVTTEGMELTAKWVPFYTFTDVLNDKSAAERGNQGTKSKIWVYGNEESGCTDKDERYTAEYVIRYCAEGVNKMVGRSDFLTLNASRQNLRVVVVGSGNSVYAVPEYRHLYDEKDAATRVTIPGSRECPIIVTTAEDVMRQKGEDDNTFLMLYDFGKLFWELGVKDGWPDFALSIYDSEDTYNYEKHLEEAYDNAVNKGLWPGTKMMDSLEEYFAYGTMVWYEGLEESADGTWQQEAFPVNSRREMLRYDEMLYGVLVEIYGEFEYFSGYTDQNNTTVESELFQNFPWYRSNQRNNYDITGEPYEPLYVAETNLISANEIELIFNREVRNIDELRNSSNWTITWDPEGNGDAVVFTEKDIICENYQWQTVTLMVKEQKWYKGFIGSDVRGFTEQEVKDGYDANSSGYKPWFTELAYVRSVGPGRKGMAVSPEIYNKYHVDGDNLIIAEKFTVTPSESALKKGQYVSLSEGTLNGEIDGTLTVTFSGDNAVDWAGNKLDAGDYRVEFKPWLGQVMRSEKSGVYVYGDNSVNKKSLQVACEYWDAILSNPKDDLGQRMADGMVWGGGGAQIMGYHNHAYMMPGTRNTYGPSNHHYLYVEGFGGGICQTTESNIMRDYTFTRYDNEFIMGHEGAHSVEITAMPYFTDMNYFVEKTYVEQVKNKDLWNNGGYSYAGSDRAEYFATLSNIWHGTMRESTDGSNNGTWLSINTREELLRYDQAGYELMKAVYYNGHTYLSEERLNQSTDGYRSEAVSGWDEEGNSINDGIIKWGCSFPYSMYEKDNDFKWISWGCANQWDVNDDHDPNSGIRYADKMINYNPYLNDDVPLVQYDLSAAADGGATVELSRRGESISKAAENQRVTVTVGNVPDTHRVSKVEVYAGAATGAAVQAAKITEVKLQSVYEFMMPLQNAHVAAYLEELLPGQHKVKVSDDTVLPEGIRITATTDAAIKGQTVTVIIDGISYGQVVESIEIKNISTGEIVTHSAIASDAILGTEPVKYSFIMPDAHVAVTVKVSQMDTVAAPTADVKAGAVERGTKVALSTMTEGARIYYTTDGTSPTVKSMEYTAPIVIESDATIKALAVHEKMFDSSIVEFKYTIKQADMPVASPKSGKVDKNTVVKLTTATENAKIYYTTDGSNPTSASEAYDDGIKITEAVTIKAVAIRENYKDSEIMSESYSIKSSSGGGSGSGGGSSSSSSSGTSKGSSYKAPEFVDLSGYEWAAQYINALAEKRIIMGTSDTTFSPAANIKRADYMVLLIRMLGLTADTSNNFSDVTSDKYYYDEVAIAKALGLATGVGDNNFNPESPISRQDMFVIAERLLNIKGVQFINDIKLLEQFSDQTSISDYAKTSVANMVSLGLVKGSDGAINPLGNATRAETAVFLYRLAELLSIV